MNKMPTYAMPLTLLFWIYQQYFLYGTGVFGDNVLSLAFRVFASIINLNPLGLEAGISTQRATNGSSQHAKH